jgi:histidinol-phosphate aminotransferase
MMLSRRKILGGIAAGAMAAIAPPPMAGRLVVPAGAANAEEGEKLIRLDKNENPYGPSELALAAMRERVGRAHRYPDAQALRDKIARHHQARVEEVVLGCGSTEILRMAADAFLWSGSKLITALPTCPLLASFARQKGVEVVEVPLTAEHSHDLEQMLARSDGSTALIYICNPNNPTGTLTGRRELEAFLLRLPPAIPVLIDEAYQPYVAPAPTHASFADRRANDDRTIVTRTFSTIHGLAGMRIGYALAPPALARRLSSWQLPFGENTVGISGAMAALDDSEYVRRSAERNRDDRQRFVNKSEVRYAGVSDSQTNFVLVPLDHPIEETIEHFRKNGILVGPRFAGLDDMLRVSIGRPEEVNAFWRVWDMMPHKPMKH